VVGGGPTGVECAGALSELIRLVLRKDYPEMDISTVRVVVLEMRDSLLPGFPAELSRVAGERLAQKHVEVCFHVRVTDFDGYQVALQDGSAISARTLIWAAGVRAAGLVDRLGVQQARQGRVVVQPTLQLEGHPEVYVIGDAAYFEAEGQPLPMMAPVAIQQARLATGNILRQVAGQPPLAFVYRDPGSLATIGRGEAVARLGRLQFHGFLAWWIWLAVHIFWLIGFRNRLLVLINWAWSYLLYDSAVRLILPAKKAKDDQ
jgi:NADH dehydrogenase